MAWFAFGPFSAYDPTQNGAAKSSTFTVYDQDDTTNSTPLVTQQLNGLPVTVTSDTEGLVIPFRVENHPAIKLVSGAYSIPAWSVKDMRDQTLAASASAATSAASAQSAATSAASLAAGVVRYVNGVAPDSGGNVSVSGGGGGGSVDLSGYYTKPQTDSAIATSQASQSTLDRNRSNHTGTQPVSSLATSGTKSASTVLHGDDVWRVPAGGGGGAVASVNGYTGVVALTKTDLGLGLVQNITPADLPVSNATQAALNGKSATSHTHAQADVTGLATALTGKASVVIVSTGSETRPSATAVLWIAAPGYAGGTPAGMATGDLFFEGA